MILTRRFLALVAVLLMAACGIETESSAPYQLGVDYDDLPGGSGMLGGGGSTGSSGTQKTPENSGLCVVLIDEDGIDNDMKTIEAVAAARKVLPDKLVNDDRPTEVGNPHFLWNELVAKDGKADVALLPTGQVDDEGWFALPTDAELKKLGVKWTLAEFVAGTVPQSKLDKIPNVMPLRNFELKQLVGRICVAVVYDSDISMNYLPIYANLQGARYGLFTFKVLAYEVPGSLAESKSNTSLFDLWLAILPPRKGGNTFKVKVRDHEPDAIEIHEAVYESGQLSVTASSDFYLGSAKGNYPNAPKPYPGAKMRLSVDGIDAGSDRMVPPTVPWHVVPRASGVYYKTKLSVSENVVGRRITISTDEGGAYNAYIKAAL